MYKKVRSLTPNFCKKTFFVLLGPNHPHPEKTILVDVCTPSPRQGGPPEKKCHLESGLNQRDQATAGFIRIDPTESQEKFPTGGAFLYVNYFQKKFTALAR